MRIRYLDLLKIFACLGVITIHVAMHNINNTLVTTTIYSTFNFYSSIARFAVPIFIMVSGVFMLDPNKEIKIKRLYSKYILKILGLYIFWSLIYGLIYNDLSFNSFLKGNYHLWYLAMLVGLYVATPFLRSITKGLKVTKYFIIIGIIFSFLIPNMFEILKLIPALDSFEKQLFQLNYRIHFGFTVCYPVYYLLGYYLHNIDISKAKEYIIYLLGIIGSILTIVLSHITTIHTLKVVETFYDLSSIAILMESVAVFVFFKKHLNIKKDCKDIIFKITLLTFNVYLIHPLVLNLLPINTMSFNPLLSVPIIIFLVLIISFILSYIINLIYKFIELLKKVLQKKIKNDIL